MYKLCLLFIWMRGRRLAGRLSVVVCAAHTCTCVCVCVHMYIQRYFYISFRFVTWLQGQLFSLDNRIVEILLKLLARKRARALAISAVPVLHIVCTKFHFQFFSFFCCWFRFYCVLFLFSSWSSPFVVVVVVGSTSSFLFQFFFSGCSSSFSLVLFCSLTFCHILNSVIFGSCSSSFNRKKRITQFECIYISFGSICVCI